MKIFLASVYRQYDPGKPSFVDFLTRCAENDRFKRHTLVDNAATADSILITEAWRHFDDWKFSRVRRAQGAMGCKHKTFVYCDADEPLYVGPGLYPSITSPIFDPYNQSSFCYLGEHTKKFENDDAFLCTVPDLLFSFAGTVQNHASRREVMKLQHKRAELFDSTSVRAGTEAEKKLAGERFKKQLLRSKFVLCPRGKGASSYRIFEVMAAGRVPVIISDAWIEPPFIEWNRFSVRVPEKQIYQIPELLAEFEPAFDEMAAICRDQYQQYLSSSALFSYLGDCLERLQASRNEHHFEAHVRHSCARALEVAAEGRRAAGYVVRSLKNMSRSKP
jgi:hypothetical protein